MVVDARLTQATGKAEREAALDILKQKAVSKKVTLGADRGYDTAEFIEELRKMTEDQHHAPHSAEQHEPPQGDRRTHHKT